MMRRVAPRDVEGPAVPLSLRIAWFLNILTTLGLLWFAAQNPMPPGFTDLRSVTEAQLAIVPAAAAVLSALLAWRSDQARGRRVLAQIVAWIPALVALAVVGAVGGFILLFIVADLLR
jgi:hypothetical protein